MKKTIHTPGPWETFREGQTGFKDQIGSTIVRQNPRNPICTVYGDDPESIANARLIAASPRLLLACLSVVREYESLYEVNDLTEEAREIFYALREAIDQ